MKSPPPSRNILRNGGIWDKDGQPSSGLKDYYDAAIINSDLGSLVAVQHKHQSFLEKGPATAHSVLPVKAPSSALAALVGSWAASEAQLFRGLEVTQNEQFCRRSFSIQMLA
jgi:hypothetical protein